MGRGMTIKAVELTNEYTAIHFIINTAGLNNYSYSINKEAYIVDANNKNRQVKYKLLTTSNCPISPKEQHVRINNVIEFVLYFESIDQNCVEIDFIEPVIDPDIGWQVKGIKLDSENRKESCNFTWKNWKNVVVTEDPSFVEDLEYVKTATKKTVKFLQEEAAEIGCNVVLVTNIKYGLTTWITGKIYRKR